MSRHRYPKVLTQATVANLEGARAIKQALKQKKTEPLIADGYVSPPKEPLLIGNGIMPAPRCPCETYLDGNVDPNCPQHAAKGGAK